MIPELESVFPEGSDLTIMNTYYQYPVFEDGKKLSDDFMVLVYKDNETGKTYNKIITKPTYSYYLAKPGVNPDYNMLFIDRDKVDRIDVPFTDLEKSIAENTGNEKFYSQNLKNRNRLENRKLHTSKRVFFSDVNIEDHYRFKFAQTYTNNIGKLNKSFFDIEADTIDCPDDFPELGKYPVNCVSFHDERTDTTYTFILRNDKNPLIARFEKKVADGLINNDYIRSFVKKSVGGWKQEKKYHLENTKYNLLFFDDEVELLTTLFRTIHALKPDFCEGYNSSAFDIEYIIERCKTLGVDPAEVMCDPTWRYKIVKNYVDYRNINEHAERGDFTFISGNTVFIDQMIQYCSRRKAKLSSYSSLKLDDIGEIEAKVKKLDYHHITNSLPKLPWLDFETFVLYNIMDVVVQKCIETKTNDLEYIFSKCITNNTIYRKGHRQTVYLINRMANDWYKMGYIIGNNINRWNEKPPKFLGALVGKPWLTDDYSKLKINGRAIWVCDNLMDFDFKSLYPSITLEFNIAPNTQIGRIIIPEKVYEFENPYKIEESKYSRGGEFIENLVTDNIIEYCRRWFGLAGFEDMLKDIDEFYVERDRFSNLQKAGLVNKSPFVATISNKEVPISFTNSSVETPIRFEIPLDETIRKELVSTWV